MSYRPLILLSVLVAGRLAAAGLDVQVYDRSSSHQCTAAGAMIVASSDDSSTDPTTQPIRAGQSKYTVTLASDRVWRITARADRCWSTSRDWSPALGTGVTLELYEAAETRGTFVAEGAEAPSQIKGWVHIESTEWQEAEAIECSLDQPKWRCTTPANLPFDLRIDPIGFAPVYYWSRIASPLKLQELEPKPLIAGSSVAGWLEDAAGKAIANGSVALTPLDETHRDLRRAEVTTNGRGFFQITGIGPGEYQLVARSAGLSPTVLPVLSIRPTESLRLPRALILVPPVTLSVVFDPPKAPDGQHWVVALYERTPLAAGSKDPAVRQAVSADGLWSAKGLRADAYRVVVQDSRDAIFEQVDVDLSKGAGSVLPIAIHALQVRGRLLVGTEPLAAEIRFSNDSGKIVRTTSDSQGNFEVPFPGPGEWLPTVYPTGHNGPRIRAKPVSLPPAGKDSNSIEIRLSGGRIHGVVMASSGEAVKAAVHVVMSAALVAQQITADDGKFDFVGLAPSHYEVSAESMAGATKSPLAIELRDDQSADVALTVDAYHDVRGIVLTPDGLPASGALVRISTDGGQMWTDLQAGVDGLFDYSLPGATAEAELLVVTHSYPASLIRLRIDEASEPLSIRLLAQGGRLHVRGKGWIVRQDGAAPFATFLLPYGDRSAYLEPGSYAVCPQPALSDQCQHVLVGVGSESSVDLGRSTGEKAR